MFSTAIIRYHGIRDLSCQLGALLGCSDPSRKCDNFSLPGCLTLDHNIAKRMAVRTPAGSSAIRRPAFKYVSFAVLAFTLFCLVYLTTQFSVQGFVILRHETAFALLSSWIQTCHRGIAKVGKRFSLHENQELDAIQPVSPYHLIPLMDHTKLLLARADEINTSTLGYSPPSFPFNIIPGRVKTSCRNFSGYALERCKTDVKTRTQLFITLVVIFGFVTLCVVLIVILRYMHRRKARRDDGAASLAVRKTRQKRAPSIPGTHNTRKRKLGGMSFQRTINPHQSLDVDEAVETEEQDIGDQDIPVTLDGMTDGWMQWIRQRANMVCKSVASHADTNFLLSNN